MAVGGRRAPSQRARQVGKLRSDALAAKLVLRQRNQGRKQILAQQLVKVRTPTLAYQGRK